MPKKLQNAKVRSYVNIQASEDGKLPSEIDILPLGTFNTWQYGEFTITEEHMEQMVANFGVRKDIPIDVDHDGGKAAGWVKSLKKAGDKLRAMVEWTKYGEELLSEKIYKMMSPEFSLAYVDPEHGTRHGAVLIAGSLVNRPLFKELDKIVAHEKNLTKDNISVVLYGSDMPNLLEIIEKSKEELTAEEIAFLNEHASELTDEQLEKFEIEKPAEAPTEEAPTEEKPEEEKPEEEKPEEAPVVEEPVEGSEKVTITAAELKDLRLKADEGYKAMQTLKAKEASETIKTYLASEGKFILPKDEDKFVSFYLACNDKMKKDFVTLLESIPSAQIAGEMGDAGSKVLTAKAQMDKLIDEKIAASDGKLTYSQALRAVNAENPKLAKEYDAEQVANSKKGN